MKTIKILIHHGKDGDNYYLVDTPKRLEATLQKLFQQLDKWGFYGNCEKGITAARAGNVRAIKTILMRRMGYQYENWDIVKVIDPI